MKSLSTKLLLVSIFFCGASLQATTHPVFGFNKVVLWGHKLHSHTHSYIHWAFHRSFEHLGYETYWLDNGDNIQHLDLSNALFITEGQVDQRIPLRDDCWYIVHNCAMEKYKPLVDKGHCIILQVYSHDCLKRGDTKIQPCMHYDLPGKVIYLPWATDLLPYEIDAQKEKVASVWHAVKKEAYFIGSSTGYGIHGNEAEISAFRKACQENGVPFVTQRGCSMEENIAHVQNSLVAPAIQGSWQVQNGYIPCRIFKNISYGALGVTNSQTVYELFNGKIVYNPDCYQLFHDAKKRMETLDLAELYELMDFVRDHHTYLNRIDSLLWFLEKVYRQAHGA